MKSAFLKLSPFVILLGVYFFAVSSNASEEEEFKKQIDSYATAEEQARWKQEFENWAESKGKIKHYAGEKTKGSTISIAGQIVKLPQDAEIVGYVVSDNKLSHDENLNVHIPFFVIQNGNSTISISENTGLVVNHDLDPSDKKPFEFLKHSISGYLEGVSHYE